MTELCVEGVSYPSVRWESLREVMTEVLFKRLGLRSDAPLVLMVSGGSDSTALAYGIAALRAEGLLCGPAALIHVNHCLRGADSDGDARFVEALAARLGLPLVLKTVDVGALVAQSGDNLEAVARQVRYDAAAEVMRDLVQAAECTSEQGVILTAHSLDDRIEAFYMRSIVGTGPGGFRAMDYQTGQVVRPLLDVTRDELRGFLVTYQAAQAGLAETPLVDEAGNLWREDATNESRDRFRSYVRHEIVPRAKAWNPALPAVLRRTMNLIGEENAFLGTMAEELEAQTCQWFAVAGDNDSGRPRESVLLDPEFGKAPVPLQRRVVAGVLDRLLGPEARLETRSIEAVLECFDQGRPRSGVVVNIQGNLAVSSNKRGVRIEPMEAFRARRKRQN